MATSTHGRWTVRIAALALSGLLGFVGAGMGTAFAAGNGGGGGQGNSSGTQNGACNNSGSETGTNNGNGNGKCDPTPLATCVWNNGNGTYTAVFGYDNTLAAVTSEPIGTWNYFTPAPQDQGQPTSFGSGVTVNNAFTITWNGATSLAWTLGTQTATITTASTPCATKPVSVVGNVRALLLALVVLVPPAAWFGRRSRLARWTDLTRFQGAS